MITRPLELEAKLSPPPRDLDMLFWVNVGLAALFFSLFGSRFVLATGEKVDLGAQPAALELPELQSAAQGAASIVVSYRRDNMVLFEGGIFELRDLRKPMEAYARSHPGSVMLVKVDKQVSVQGLLDLFDLAKGVGFVRVIVAAEPKSAEGAGMVSPLR